MLNFTLLYIYCLKVNSSHARMSGPPPHGHYPATGQHQPPPPGQYYPQVSVVILLHGININPLSFTSRRGLLLCVKSVKLNDCFKMNTREIFTAVSMQAGSLHGKKKVRKPTPLWSLNILDAKYWLAANNMLAWLHPSFTKNTRTTANHNHNYKLYVKGANLNCSRNLFFVWIINAWNSLPVKLFMQDHWLCLDEDWRPIWTLSKFKNISYCT